MKFIIFICDRIRHGQFPRLPDFPFNETHGKYIYQGRELTAEEFTAAAEVVFDPYYRTQGYTLRPGIVTASEIPAPAPVLAPVESEPVQDDVPSPVFRWEGKSIFLGDDRVGGLFGEGDKQHLRVVAEHADLRPEIEEWLATQTNQ